MRWPGRGSTCSQEACRTHRQTTQRHTRNIERKDTMPNHVRQQVTVFGPARDVTAFVLLSQTPKPPTGDTEFYADGRRNWNYEAQQEEPASRVIFDLHGVVPLPERYSQVEYSKEGYDLEVATWGVK